MPTWTFPEIRALLRCGQRLPNHLAQEIAALGDAAVDPLRELLRDRSLWLVEAEGEGCAPIHAAKLLGRLRAERAVPDLLEALADTEPMDILYSTLIHALARIGPGVVGPVLAFAGSIDAEATLDACGAILSGTGIREDSILAFLLDRLAANVGLGASLLAEYGDPAALPHLHAALAEVEIEEGPFSNQPIVELVAAIDELDGALTPAEQLKHQAATAEAGRYRAALLGALQGHRPARQPSHVRSRTRLGRNQKCWCGSGAKYKRCHYDSDRQVPAA